jgi:hypothetical protein
MQKKSIRNKDNLLTQKKSYKTYNLMDLLIEQALR